MNTVLTRAPRKVLLGASVPVLALLGLGAGSAMSASAADPVAEMTATPNPLTFDGVAVGSTKDADVTLRSSGTAAVTVANVANVGRDSAQYSLVADACSGKVLAPGATCAVTLRFAPTTSGTRVTNLRFQATNACTRYVNVAGGATASAARAKEAEPSCEVVAGPTQTVTAPASTVTTPGTTVTAPSTTVTAPGRTVVAPAAVVTVPSAPVTVTSPAATTVSAASAAQPATISSTVAGVSASSPKVCRSRRSITLNVKPRAGTTLAKVSVRVNGRLSKVFKRPAGGRLAARLSLSGLPRTRVKVDIRSVTTKGQVARRTQYFVTCVPKGA